MQQSKTIFGIIVVALLVIGGTYAMTNTQSPRTSTSTTVKTLGTITTQTPTDTSVSTSVSSTTTTTSPKPATSTPAPKPKPATSTPAPSTPGGYTAVQVGSHDSAASCWTVVNGNVYDLTSWIAKHPGGQGSIKMMCGADASDAFNQQHGGQGGPERILASYKIGTFLN